MNEKDPPPYGAQQRQDALWEGEQSHCDIRWVTQQDTRRQWGAPSSVAAV